MCAPVGSPRDETKDSENALCGSVRFLKKRGRMERKAGVADFAAAGVVAPSGGITVPMPIPPVTEYAVPKPKTVTFTSGGGRIYVSGALSSVFPTVLHCAHSRFDTAHGKFYVRRIRGNGRIHLIIK